jgi:quinol-cytochrome oxidoreductase complex cytochrome b subunit
VSSVKYEVLANSTCKWSEGRFSNTQLTCTRELVACELINFLTETNWADNRRVCRETKGARVILVPLTVLTFVLVALYGLRIHMSKTVKSVDDGAEERVERLQEEE